MSLIITSETVMNQMAMDTLSKEQKNDDVFEVPLRGEALVT